MLAKPIRMHRHKKGMSPCWGEQGLTERGALRAEAAIGRMCELVRELHPLTDIVYKEAVFRVVELPTRSKDFQQSYKARNK